MSIAEVETILLADVSRERAVDPDRAVEFLQSAHRATEAQARDAIVRLVDRHQLTFTNDCMLVVTKG